MAVYDLTTLCGQTLNRYDKRRCEAMSLIAHVSAVLMADTLLYYGSRELVVRGFGFAVIVK